MIRPAQMQDVCRLCGQPGERQLSLLIPFDEPGKTSAAPNVIAPSRSAIQTTRSAAIKNGWRQPKRRR